MSQNAPQKEDTAPKKRFPYFSAVLALLIAAGIGTAAYFALFPGQKPDIPFVSEETKQQINNLLPNSSAEQNQNGTANLQEQNSNYSKAAEIFEKLTPSEENGQNGAGSVRNSTEDELNIVDMTPKAETSSAENADSDGFSLEPPSSVAPLESGRKMLTEEEIKEAQERDRQEKLAKLEELRQGGDVLSDNEKNSLPGREGTLSSLVPNADFDPVVTIFFIQDLAEYLVNNYKTDNNGSGRITLSMPKLNERYGVGLYGLEHAKGRQGVLEYAYNGDMIPVLYKFLSPLLIDAMKQKAAQKNMSEAMQKDMFKSYAKFSMLYAQAVRELNAMPQLGENLQNLRAIELSLKEEEKFFADNLLSFEQNRENKNIARTYEQNIKQSTIRTEQLRTRVKNVKNDLKQYLAGYSANLAAVPHVMELALWLDRRQNPSANAAFADALAQFGVDLEKGSE